MDADEFLEKIGPDGRKRINREGVAADSFVASLRRIRERLSVLLKTGEETATIEGDSVVLNKEIAAELTSLSVLASAGACALRDYERMCVIIGQNVTISTQGLGVDMALHITENARKLRQLSHGASPDTLGLDTLPTPPKGRG